MMRGRRCSIALTMISPARSGGIFSRCWKRFSDRAWSAALIAFDIRALRAMEVAMPPGWTVVTPTPEPSSSCRSDSEKPRTANLLAE